MATYLATRPDRALRASSTSAGGAGAQRARRPAGPDAGASTPTFGRQPRDDRDLRRAVRALPVRALHRRRHRRRPRDPARGAGPVDLRREPPRRRLGRRSGSSPTSWPTSGSATASPPRRWQRHLAARGLRLLRRVAVVGGVGRTTAAGAGPSGTTPVLAAPAPGPRARRPRAATTCSTTGSTSAARSPCTRCAAPSATTLFFALLRAWVDTHRYGVVTTADFEALVRDETGVDPERAARPVAARARPAAAGRRARDGPLTWVTTVAQPTVFTHVRGQPTTPSTTSTRGPSTHRPRTRCTTSRPLASSAVATAVNDAGRRQVDPHRVVPDDGRRSAGTTPCRSPPSR